MKLSIVSRHPPEREGTSPGRALLAWCEGARALGHQLSVWCWGPDAPHTELPAWCEWRPLPREPWVRMKGRALVRPRTDVVIGGWEPEAGSVSVADDPVSFPAVARFHPNVLTQHYATVLDAPALARRELRDRQDLRAEARNARDADVVLAYSERVAATLPVPAVAVPIAYPVPRETLPPPDEPVAVLLADWRWPPNQRALRLVLDAWPVVRETVPAAELVLAGRGLDAGSITATNVRAIGPVTNALDALALGSVFAFPCPATSGPKVKVIEAMAYGLPVVTTPFGAEGVWAEPNRDLVSVDEDEFGAALAGVLSDGSRRAALAQAGRAAVVAHHASEPAARAKLGAISAGLAAERSGRRAPGRRRRA
jgi:glycosyltransferase involved in cell wall biosynthesis